LIPSEVITVHDTEHNTVKEVFFLPYPGIASTSKHNPQPDVNDLIHWETMIPVFSSPHNLQFNASAYLVKGDTQVVGKITPSNIVITITEDTDLNNIHLGSFTVE
jgi:hypothetical protein